MALMSPRYRILCKFAVVMMVVMAIATMSSCDTAMKDEELDQHIAQVEKDRTETAAAMQTASAEAKAELAVRLEALILAEQQLKSVREKLKQADASANAIAGGISTIGSAVPIPGVNTALALLGSTGLLGAAASWLSRMKWVKVARQVVEGLDKAKAENPALATALSVSKATIKSVQDNDVQKAIDTLRA